jgi:hypothetical protein
MDSVENTGLSFRNNYEKKCILKILREKLADHIR